MTQAVTYIACYGVLPTGNPNIPLSINSTYSTTRAIFSYHLRPSAYQSYVHLQTDHHRRPPAQAAFL